MGRERVTAQEAYVHLQLRHRHACDRLGNGIKTLWSSEDIEATAVLLRWAASRSNPPAEPAWDDEVGSVA